MKDIFIDNDIAGLFTNPIDEGFKQLLVWLLRYGNDEDDAYLVVSSQLLNEYNRSNQHCNSGTNICVIVGQLLREGRLIKRTNKEIDEFQRKYFTKRMERRFRSNVADRSHIPVVCLSNRKLALTNDQNLTYDLLNFPGYDIKVSNRPEGIPYL